MNKFDKAYLKMAQEWAKLSYCKRKQVGALIVKDRMIISDGYNGTHSKTAVKMKREKHTGMYCMQKLMLF